MDSLSASILIVSYHTGPTLWESIASALEQEAVQEVIVVDNGNSFEVRQRLQHMLAHQPRLRLVSGHGNIGFAKACNVGAHAATGHYLFFLNPKCMLHAGAVLSLSRALEAHTEAWVTSPKRVYPDGQEYRGGRLNLFTFRTALVESLELYRLPWFSDHERFYLHTLPSPSVPSFIPATSSACMFLTRARFLAMGGFDEGFSLRMEDLDFCYRLHQLGGKILYVPDVVVVHHQSLRHPPALPTEQHTARGLIRYYHKHLAGRASPVMSVFFLSWVYGRLAIRLTLFALRAFFSFLTHFRRS